MAATVMAGPGRLARADVGDQAKAEDLIRQANELRRRGDNAPAFRLYVQAYELSRTPRTAAQLALSELSLGYWRDAHEHLTEALTSVTFHPWIADNRATLEAQLAVADSHLAELTIEGKPDGADVVINRKRVGALPLPGAIKVNEGRIDIELRAPGHEPMSRTLTLAGKGHERVFVTLVPTATPAAPVVVSAPPARREDHEEVSALRRALPWTLLAAGAAGLGIGVWQHLAWRQSVRDFDAVQACGEDDPNYGADTKCKGLHDDLSAHRTATFIAYGAAGALAGTAIAIFMLDSGKANGGAAPSVAFTPGGFHASYRITF